MDNLGLFNVIIGKNRTGKSSILKLLLNYLSIDEKFWPLNKKSDSNQKFFLTTWRIESTDFKWLYQWSRELQNKLILGKIYFIDFSITNDERELKIYSADKEVIYEKKDRNPNAATIGILFFGGKRSIWIPAIRFKSENFENRVPKTQLEKDQSDIYHILGKDQEKLDLNLLFNLIYQQKRNNPPKYEIFKGLVENLIHIEFDIIETETAGFQLVFNYEDGGYKFERDFASLGTGTQQLFFMFFVFSALENCLILIDEPELGLHPGLQKELYYTLVDLAQQNNNQFVIATHSPIFLDLSNNIYLLENTERGSVSRSDITEKKKVILSELGVPLWGYLFSKGIIFVEGPTDCEYLGSFAEKLGINPSEFVFKELGGYDRYHLVKNEIVEIPHFLVLDRHSYPEEKIARIRQEVSEENFHILKYYEIENYLINFDILARLINERKPELNREEVKNDLKRKFEEICELYKKEVIIKYLFNEINEKLTFKRSDIKSISEEVNSIAEVAGIIKTKFEEKINDRLDIVKLIPNIEEKINKYSVLDLNICSPGKEILKDLRNYIAEKYQICFVNEDIINNLREEEIHSDIKLLFTKISRKLGLKLSQIKKKTNIKIKDWNQETINRQKLVAESAGRCNFPGCNERLAYSYDDRSIANIIEFCHIIPLRKKSLGGCETESELNEFDPENIILLCAKHHRIVDGNEQAYPPEKLCEMKANHLKWVKHRLDGSQETN